MSRASSVVEINGNRYDAATGQLIGSVKKSAHQLRSSASGVVDGFIRQSSQVSAKKRVVKNRAKHTAQTFHKKAERSRTLMRSAVAKPEPKRATSQSSRAVFSADIKKPSPKHSLHARTVSLHKNVNRFGHLHKPLSGPTATKHTTSSARTENKRPVALSSTPSMISSATHSHIERLLDQALSSKNHKPGPARRGLAHNFWHRLQLMPKWLSFGVLAVVLAISVGLFAWQKVPQVAVKLAATRANVNASVPAYTPDGFSFAAPISYSKGQVKVRYQTGTGQSYEITQQATKLDSVALASSVLSAETNVQTSQVKGNTVYIYGDKNDATWVNNGVRYTITDQAGLDPNQILKIAGSL